MARNLDQATAPLITTVPESRNFEVVQGDERALVGVRFRDRISTADAPVYDPIHASEWAGHVLRSRGGTQNAPLTFNNVAFNYTSGGNVMFSNREVQVHIPWENTMLQELNPPPNRPINLLYDIWNVTYPNSTDSYVSTEDGDKRYYTRSTSSNDFDRVDRLTNTSVRVQNLAGATDFNYNIGAVLALNFRFDGSSTDNYIIGQVITRSLSADPQHVDLQLFSFVNGGETTDVPSVYGGSVQSTSTIHELSVDTNTAPSRVRFRGTIAVRERIYNNANAGNEDTPTNGG